MIEKLKQNILAKAAKISYMNKGFNSTGLIDYSKWIKRKFTACSMDKQGVVTETYQILKKVGQKNGSKTEE